MRTQIPQKWSWKTVGEFTVEHKQGYYTKEPYTANGIYLIRITDLGNPKIDYAEMPRLKIDEREYQQFKVNIGDFLFARSGAIGRYGIVEKSYPAIFASYLIRFKFDESSVRTKYFGYVYESDLCQKQLASITQGSSNININAENIKSLLIPFAPLREQEKIASVLTSVDDVIESTQAQISKLKDLKTGMMQELLTKGVGHTKFKDSLVGNIPANWDVATIGDVFNMASGSTPSRKDATYFSNSGDSIPWVKTMDLHDGLITTTNEKITQRAIDETSCKLLPIGTTLLAMYGGWNQIGRSGVLGIQAATNQAICALIPKDKIGGSFCNYWMISKRWVWKAVAASSRKDPNITKQDVQEFLIAIPPTAEQDEIVKRLDSATILISAKEEKLSHLRDIKMALMQDLLTGKVRVNVN